MKFVQYEANVVKIVVNSSSFKLTPFFQKHTRECTANKPFTVLCDSLLVVLLSILPEARYLSQFRAARLRGSHLNRVRVCYVNLKFL